MPDAAPALYTLGHGTASAAELTALLRAAGVAGVVDIRRFPGSRRHPQHASDALAARLPDEGIAYRWEPRLGGRRRLPTGPTGRAGADAPDGLDSPDGPDQDGPVDRDAWWQVAAFRAYAAHTRTAEFAAALDDLVAEAAGRPTAVLCSESLWWRCHRRLVADAVVLLRGLPVRHLAHDGRVTAHEPSAGARVAPDGLEYPASPDPGD